MHSMESIDGLLLSGVYLRVYSGFIPPVTMAR